MNNILGFVPARGGSKGIPQKNLYSLAGKPLIQYTLDVLNGLGDVITPFISTEDEKIKEYCELNGFPNDYMRPANLARDETTTIETLIDALDWVESNSNLLLESVLLLQSTSPLRTTAQILEAIEKFKNNNCSSLVSVTPMGEHPSQCVKLDGSGWQYLEESKNKLTRRQDYDDGYFHINGAIYLAKIEQIRKYKEFVIPNVTELFLMDKKTSIDIDEMDDVIYAEYLLRNK